MFDLYKDGKVNWPYVRQIFYVGLFVWLVGVRMMNINPFDDFGKDGEVSLATLLDALSLFAIYIVTWHVIYPARPKFSA